MTTLRTLRPWSTVAVNHLLDGTSCPVCEVDALVDRRCRNCGAELSDDMAAELWTASKAAAEALMARQEVLERVLRPAPADRTATEPGVQAPPRVSVPRQPRTEAVVRPEPRSSATVQSVLAVAGAGLFAVSAFVFTFVNPDLTDRALRSVIVGLITILFLGGAWLLARRKLQFSAEAVGGLGMLFLALDISAFSELAPTGASPWVFAATGTLIGGTVMVIASVRARIRSWLWISLLGLALVPAMLGYAGGGTSLSATIGYLGVAFAALALMGLMPRLERSFGERVQPERTALAILQVLAVAIVLTQVWFVGSRSTTAYWLTISAVLAVVAVLAVLTTRQFARTFWSATAGAAGVGAAISLPLALALGSHGVGEWDQALLPAAGVTAVLVLNAITRTVPSLGRRPFLGGALVVAGVSVVSPVLIAMQIGTSTVLSALVDPADARILTVPPGSIIAVVVGLAAAAAGLGAFSAITGRGGAAWADDTLSEAASVRLASVIGTLALWILALAGLTFACLSVFPVGVRIALALGLAATVSLAIVAVPRIRDAAVTTRLPLIVGSHLAVLLAIVYSRTDDSATVLAGIAVVVTIAVLCRTVPTRARFLHVGAGYAYALVVIATALAHQGVETIPLLCLTTSVASIGAIAATFLRWVTPSAWHAILVVTSVPFLIGILQVVFERSGWTALSTSLIFLLALTLLVSRRPGLSVVLRAIAAGLLVPSLAVVVVCLGAQVLLGSASPVTLPVIATIAATVLPSTSLIGSVLEKRGIGAPDATAARIAIEASTALTAVIAVVLALVRDAAGLPTTFIVLVILGFGAAATSVWADRRYGWWVAGAAFTGALWCLWAIAGIDVLEPYLLPPSLAAATIGMILTARGHRASPLYTTGLVMAVAPVLVVLAVSGTGDLALAPWRGYGLVAASWVLLALGAVLGRGSSTRARLLRTLRTPTLCVAIAAGAAGAIQGVRFGLGADPIITGGIPLVLLCFGIGLAGALPAAAAARALRSAAVDKSLLAHTRWLYAPAALYVAIATWTAIERDWFTIWAMWSLMLAYLITVLVIAWRVRTHASSLPPVWFIFGIAFVTSIVAWSPRDLRVEWFSVPLGLFLLAAGAIILAAREHPDADRRTDATVNSWPAGWGGSWALLSPGLVTLLSASVTATFTDPQTWRAIFVIVVALVAILIGSSLKLAAPFVLGIVVLPIENVVVFLVQIGRGIESMPWWITLAVVGAVLLIIAVTYERRAGDANTVTDRLRDLA
ncbi:SCO7613 C-terminal domain-containing membrane protein [Mycetocola zhujimingii]|uniref:DUF2157 domain-containing protein n=1 Tax=Mycetocola zhujimingii TaxID=2079792 RepID=A0A2U1THG5_9MICO|nr:hypothetical protein [Mycetocola zhujimingii]PWC08318.1 hypothetical protein DF223_02975 [Mycetocola zhujimingii]